MLEIGLKLSGGGEKWVKIFVLTSESVEKDK